MASRAEPLCHFGGRLYFTTFPHPAPHPDVLNNQESDTQPRIRGTPSAGPSRTPDDDAKYYYFTVDNQFLYLSFYQDWGPFNLSMVYKSCILIHELLQDRGLASHRLVLYSSSDPRRKANAALLMSLYVMIVQQRPPWEAFRPIAELEFMPFRDAGRGRSDFNLSIQDCLWGVYKAMQNGLCDMNEFDVEDYEYYEKVENGDWNWLTPNFIAFASPVDLAWIKKEKDKQNQQNQTIDGPPSPTKGGDLALQRKLPTPFQNCLEYFEKKNVKLVVRLNNPLYDRQLFIDRGIHHVDLYFDDGTNPTDEIVRKFIDMADEVIENGGVVAVHCKAGLGRTGTLIGAYLVWKYGFTASEAIAFMRIVRPGSVVGPQQQYMYLKQLEWSKWAAVDEMRKLQNAAVIAATTLVVPATPPAEEDSDMLDSTTTSTTNVTIVVPTTPPRIALPPVTPSKHIAAAQAKAKAISPPGQPRKTPAAKRVAKDLDSDQDENDDVPPLGGAPLAAPIRKVRPKPASARAAGARLTPAEQRSARVTRSVATANLKKGTATNTTIAAKAAKLNGQGPNKVPRLADGTSTRGTTLKTTTVDAPALSTRSRARQVATPTPSRLPVARRPGHKSTASVQENPTTLVSMKAPVPPADWMSKDAAAVVVTGPKSGRPGLRPIRRRRSSFSEADVVA